MNNHLERLRLRRGAPVNEVLSSLENSELERDENQQARTVLLDPFRRLHFERVHRQYEAMAAARRTLLPN